MNKPIKQKLNVPKVKADDRKQQWWDPINKATAHSDMIQLIKAIQENQKAQYIQDIRHAYLYSNRYNPLLGVNSTIPDSYGVTFNVVKSTVDTITAKLAQNKPRPRIVTEKGDYSQQARAKKLTKYLDGTFLAAGTYRHGNNAFRDGSVFGTGVMKVWGDKTEGCIKTERVLVTEIVVDDLEGAYGDPQSMYQVKVVSKAVLMAQYPKFAREIEQSNSESQDQVKIKQTSDTVKVYEGWHLGENGLHILAIDGCTLASEPWEHDKFPFAFFRYNSNIANFCGQGIAEELLGTQLEINKILRDIQRAQNLIAVPRVLLEYNSRVIGSHLNNEIGSAIKWQGTKPDFFTPTAMNNEIYNHVKWLIQTAYEKVGISQLSATSKKPAGLDSGRALRDYQDIESERFALTEENYNTFFLDIAHLAILFSRDLYTGENKVSPKVKVDGQKFIETIEWKDVDLDDDKFIMKMYSASIFPTQPAAKIQKAEEYVRAGWMGKETAIRLLDMPDLEAWENEEIAVQSYVEKAVTMILESETFMPPEPELIDPEGKAVNIMKKAYIDALTNNVSEEKSEKMLRWIEMAASLMPMPIQPEAAPAQATPMPLPQSGVLPQV